MRPMMNTTIMISTSVKPADRARSGQRVIDRDSSCQCRHWGLRHLPLRRRRKKEVVVLTTRARKHILIRVTPGVIADALDISAFSVVAHRGVIGTLRQRLESEISARILVVVELVHRQRSFDGLDVTLGLRDLRSLDVSEDIRQDHGRQQANDHHDHHDFDEREAAGGTKSASHGFPVGKGLLEDRGRIVPNER